MLLLAVATENEIKPLTQFLAANGIKVLVTGMGPVRAAASLSSYLTRYGSNIKMVLNIGVAGAYIDSGIALLDICLAQQEFLGDFGICMNDGIHDFDHELLKANDDLSFDSDLVARCRKILNDHDIPVHMANFVTVNCCSGTEVRGDFLRKKFAAGCENMEGAAVAMTCKNFAIACVELRCISNMVENRDTGKWKLSEAIEKICQAARIILQHDLSGNVRQDEFPMTAI